MKKLFLFAASLGLLLTGCDNNDDSASTVLTSEITVDGASFKPSGNGITTFTEEGDGGTSDYRYFSLVRGNGDNISQAIYINLQLREGRTNDGGSYIFDMGETATNLFADGTYVEGDMSYHLASGTVHVTEMTDGYFKLQFEDVLAMDVFGGAQKHITGEFKAKFRVYTPQID